MRIGLNLSINRKAGGNVYVSPIVNGLASYWKLEESSGTRFDQMGTNNLTAVGAVSSTTGKIGNCASFSGVAQNLFVNDNGTLESATDLTVSMWYKSSNVAQMWAINKGNFSLGDYMLTTDAAGKMIFKVNTAAVGDTVSTMDGTFHFAVGQFRNGNIVQLWIDNVSKGTFAASPSLNNIELRIGGIDASNFQWVGQLDEIGVWTRALTVTEIGQLWNGGAGLSYPFPGT